MNKDSTPQFRAPSLANYICHSGNASDEAFRLLFCNYVVSFADLDSYARRADFIAAFGTGGTLAARRREAAALADSGLLMLDDIIYCRNNALRGDDMWARDGSRREIV